MRRLFGLLAVMILLAGPSAALGLGAMVSGWSPDKADDDVGGGLILDIDTAGSWDLEIKTIWFQDMGTLVEDERAKFTSTVFDFGAAYNFRRGKTVNPYLGGGGSYYLFDLEENRFGEISNEAGWYVEAGLEIMAGQHWLLFGEGLWREVEATIKGDDLGFSGIENGFDMHGFSYNIGLMYRW